MGFDNLIEISDLLKEDVETIFALAGDLKKQTSQGDSTPILQGKTLAMIFEKPNLRTRVSFEAGMQQLGGNAIYLGSQEINLGVRESVADCARVLERYIDGIMARTFSHETVIKLAEQAKVPVINGLTDYAHPCQVLADCFTIQEKLGTLAEVTVAYVGDGNNVTNSFLNAAVKCGFSLRIGCPKGYEPDADLIARAQDTLGERFLITEDAAEAVSNAHVVYTDVWASMGKEDEIEQRRAIFKPYQVNSELLSEAAPEALVMHCLPAHRGDEITDEVIDGKQSIVYDEAENRLHVQKAIMVMLMSGYGS